MCITDTGLDDLPTAASTGCFLPAVNDIQIQKKSCDQLRLVAWASVVDLLAVTMTGAASKTRGLMWAGRLIEAG